MSVALWVLGGAGVLWALVWIIGRLSRPPAWNHMSDAWLDAQKYDRKHRRPE